MKKILGLMVMMSLVAVAASGCGSDSPPGNQAGYANRTQGGNGGAGGIGGNGGGAAGNTCSDQLISDVQAILQNTQTVQANPTLTSLRQLRTQVATFKNTYAGVVCVAPATGKTFDVDAQITPLLTQIDQAIQQMGGEILETPVLNDSEAGSDSERAEDASFSKAFSAFEQ